MKTLLSILSINVMCGLVVYGEHSNNMEQQIELANSLRIPMTGDVHSDASAVFFLGQPWNTEPDTQFKPGKVQVSWSPKTLLVETKLIDDDVSSRATGDNQKMWELGDVFEVFLQLEGHDDYVELHITPNNNRLHVHKPNVEGKLTPDGDELPIEEMMVHPIGFTSEVTQEADGWTGVMSIPPSVFGLDAFSVGDTMLVSFCRYDASGPGEPILSTTSSHEIINFHQPKDWVRIRLSEAGMSQ